MLAQNFKTPTDLGISDKEFDALVNVLGMLERCEIKEEYFSMGKVKNCGSPSCILGWARHVSSCKNIFALEGDFTKWRRLPTQVRRLFAYVESTRDFDAHVASPSQAAIALRNYLTTGEPNWAEALAESAS